MSIIFLTEQLKNMENPKRDNRQRVADIVLENQNLFKDLVTLTFKTDDKISIKAAWVLEWICTHDNLDFMIPHLNKFTTNINKVIFDSAIRPCAKICEHFAKAFYSKKINEIQVSLTEQHIDAIVETGFDWLITPQKIAVRAYTMNTLFLFGLDKNWVHPELKHLIESKIIHESKGCKARGKQVLNLIQKLKERRL